MRDFMVDHLVTNALIKNNQPAAVPQEAHCGAGPRPLYQRHLPRLRQNV